MSNLWGKLWLKFKYSAVRCVWHVGALYMWKTCILSFCILSFLYSISVSYISWKIVFSLLWLLSIDGILIVLCVVLLCIDCICFGLCVFTDVSLSCVRSVLWLLPEHIGVYVYFSLCPSWFISCVHVESRYVLQ
jgi:hypothetical protein